MKPTWIAFLGPTLSEREARRFGCEVRAPARQGDVWRALVDRPRALVLIDGVFEAQPSVWHHELRAAIAAGVVVFGASSMGALRAAELSAEGMIGIGAIFRSYRDRKRVDDADVALLHADQEHGFRPLTLPLVNAEHALQQARTEKVLTAPQARKLRAAAAAIHYQQRRWPDILSDARLERLVRARFENWLAARAVDLKAEDARECLGAAAAWISSGAPGPDARACPASSHVRRRRLVDANPGMLEKLGRSPDAARLADAGTRRRLLAGWARASGLAPRAARVAHWLEQISPEAIAEDERVRIAEDCALEEQLLESPERWLADGPSRHEGLADQAVLERRWKK
jgi:hypothetical protein